jgi:nucleoid-associated protein YgaU
LEGRRKMGFFDFVKEAGEKLLGGKEARAEAKQDTETALVSQVKEMGLKVEGLRVDFNEGVATLKGKAPSQEEREKIVLMVGNTKGVARVDDQMTVEAPAPEAALYTVKSGDSLSKIAKVHYGDASKYPVIFEANKPMLKDPNKIYPGQVLRIPPV